jgi:putative endonuclease
MKNTLSKTEKTCQRRRAYRRGLFFERIAGFYLRLKGYRLLAQRAKTPFGEVDLLMARGKTLIAVEVKKRRTLYDALMSLSFQQKKRNYQAACFLLTRYSQYGFVGVRFDLIAVGRWTLRHLKNVMIQGVI